MRHRFQIQNKVAEVRARWPDWFVAFVLDWLVHRIGDGSLPYRIRVILDAHYETDKGLSGGKVVPKHRRYLRDVWSGEAWYLIATFKVKLHRRNRVFKWRDTRWKDGHRQVQFDIRNNLEQFIFLTAHEFRHLTSVNRALFDRPGGKYQNRYAGELDANRFGMDCVRDWRRDWPALRATLYETIRELRREKPTWRRGFVLLNDPDARILRQIEAAENKLMEWQKAARRAALFVTKYRRKLTRLEANLQARQRAAERTHKEKPHDVRLLPVPDLQASGQVPVSD